MIIVPESAIAGLVTPADAFAAVADRARGMDQLNALVVARDGETVFAEAFRGQLPLARHRAVYAALGDMMTTDIHALSIDARTPDELRQDTNR